MGPVSLTHGVPSKRPSVMLMEMERPPGIEEERDVDTECGDITQRRIK